MTKILAHNLKVSVGSQPSVILLGNKRNFSPKDFKELFTRIWGMKTKYVFHNIAMIIVYGCKLSFSLQCSSTFSGYFNKYVFVVGNWVFFKF